jgi:hypothetical protein
MAVTLESGLEIHISLPSSSEKKSRANKGHKTLLRRHGSNNITVGAPSPPQASVPVVPLKTMSKKIFCPVTTRIA